MFVGRDYLMAGRSQKLEALAFCWHVFGSGSKDVVPPQLGYPAMVLCVLHGGNPLVWHCFGLETIPSRGQSDVVSEDTHSTKVPCKLPAVDNSQPC